MLVFDDGRGNIYGFERSPLFRWRLSTQLVALNFEQLLKRIALNCAARTSGWCFAAVTVRWMDSALPLALVKIYVNNLVLNHDDWAIARENVPSCEDCPG